LPREKFATVYNGVEEIFYEPVSPEIFRTEFKITEPFVLNVGNIEPRKNQINLAKAMKSFPEMKLVLIGHIRDPKYAEAVFAEGVDQIIHIGTLVHGSELQRSAYAACEVFCLPSTLETPGLAALESAACGAKIVITEEGSTKEYFGNQVTYCDPTSTESISNRMYLILSASEKENEHSFDLLWSNQIKALIKLYNRVFDV
jgi:glycosyltransferase involved in cell wall biosynthesis